MLTTLSIIIPVFNEEKTVHDVLEKVCTVQLIHNIKKQIIIVDDTSRDGSVLEIEKFLKTNSQQHELIFLKHSANKGKGAAIHTALKAATGDYIIIQDADLELDPNDFNKLLAIALEKNADVVYGSRFLEKQNHNMPLLSKAANNFLTLLTKFLAGKNITDMETCYKLVRASLLRNLVLKENRFGFEPEVTMKLLRNRKIIFHESPVYYKARTSQQGKKIGVQDGLRAVYCLVKYRFFD